MPTARDYRKQVTRSLLWIFFGLLAAAIAPDLGLGIKKYTVIASVAALAFGAFRMSAMPVRGSYRPIMVAAAALFAVYAGARCLLAFGNFSDSAVSWTDSAARGLGAIGLFLLCAAVESFSRRLKWPRLARGWVLTELFVGVIYVIPAVFGWFWNYYAPYIGSWRAVSALHYELADFDFHGIRVPDIVGGPRWLIILALVLLAPVTAMLVNLLRTYVHAASPPPPADNSEPIQWSRR